MHAISSHNKNMLTQDSATAVPSQQSCMCNCRNAHFKEIVCKKHGLPSNSCRRNDNGKLLYMRLRTCQPYNNESKKCNLCLQEKYFIIFRQDLDYNTRSKNNIHKSASSRNWGHWSSTNFASNDWNKLDPSIRQSPSLASFKRALRLYCK